MVLASGGYQSNPELRLRYQPGFVGRAPCLGIDTCRGDGHLMGQAVGGDLINMTFVPPLVIVSSSVVEDAIAVNEAGERFHDEAGPYEERVERLHAQPGRRAWYVLDDVVAREKAALIGQMPEPPVTAPGLTELAAAIGARAGPGADRRRLERLSRLRRRPRPPARPGDAAARPPRVRDRPRSPRCRW